MTMPPPDRAKGFAADHMRPQATNPSKMFARTMATEAPASKITKSADMQSIMQSWTPGECEATLD